jgi:DNA-binding NarL/FixJ family response regulator
MIEIFIADDHPIFINGVKTALEGVKDITITGEALNGEQLLDMLNILKLDRFAQAKLSSFSII